MAATRLLGGGFARASGVPLAGTLDTSVLSRTTLIENQGVHFYLPSDPVIESLIPFGPSGRRDWSKADVYWYFGDGADPTSEVWAHSLKPQDEDTGVSAAHVYETAGTKNGFVEIRVGGVLYTYAFTVTVTASDTAFSGLDIYFNPATGNDAWDGTSATFVSGTTGPKATIHSYRATYLALAAAKRINLAGGQTHNVTSAWSRTGTATFAIEWRSTPGTGTATINTSGCTGGWLCGGIATENTLFHDIDVTGTATDAVTRPGKNWTFLRTRWTGFDSGSTTSSGHGNKQYVFFQEVTVDETESYNIYFNFGQKCGILGCTLNGVDELTGEHNLRSYLTQTAIAHNRFKFPRFQKHAVKFVGYFPTGDVNRAGTEGTETVIHTCLHDNVTDEVRVDCQLVWDLGPVDNSKDQRTQDCFCYNNLLVMANSLGDCNAQVAFIVRNEDWTLYDNVVDLSQIPSCDAVRIIRRGIEPQPTRCRAYNTTVYSSAAMTGDAVQVASGAVDSEAYNTFMVRPSGGTILNDAGTATLSGTNITATSGLAAPGGIAGDYSQVAGSGGLATGTLLDRVQRYRNGTLRTAADAGADAQATATTLPTVSTPVLGSVTATSIDYASNCTDDGGAAVTAKGVCWNTTGSPTLADEFSTDGTGEGAFGDTASPLLPETEYFFRAYSTNSVGTQYSGEASETTAAEVSDPYTPPASAPTVPIAEGVVCSKLQQGSTLRVYRQCMKQSRFWISCEAVDGADTGLEILINATTGYPIEIPQDDGTNPPQYAATVFLDVDTGTHPIGTYTIVINGDGDCTIGRNGSGSFSHDGVGTLSSTFSVPTSDDDGISVTITRSNVADPISIEIFPPDSPDDPDDDFHIPFVELYSRFAGNRNLDIYRVNNKTFETSLVSRKDTQFYTSAYGYAMPFEDQVELANRAQHSLFWLLIPELAEQDLVTWYGQYLRDNLNSTCLIIVANGNEHWNGQFGMKNRYLALGGALWPTATSTQARHRYYARKSAQVFQWLEAGLGAPANTRLIKVLEGQASATSEISGVLAAFAEATITDGAGAQEVNPNGVAYQAIEIHPYLGAATAGSGTNLCDTVKTQGLTTVAQVISLIRSTFMPSVMTRVADHKVIADSAGVVLVAGECGINAVGTGANLTDDPLNELMRETLRDREIQPIYREYMDGLRANGVKTAMHYALMQAYTNLNTWGLLEEMNQSIRTSWRLRGFLGLRTARVPLMVG